MRRDKYGGRDVRADFIGIRQAKNGKRRKRLARLQPFVFKRFAEYLWRRKNLEVLNPISWTPRSHEALSHCYSSKTAVFKAALEHHRSLSSLEPYRCPYCLMRQPKTWDHFLPKERFPEFAALIPNLIRICDTCNRKKGQRFTGLPREVINPFFDGMPDEPVLFCDLTIPAGCTPALRYYILGSIDVPVTLTALAERHFEAFELQHDLINEGSMMVDVFVEEITFDRIVPYHADELKLLIETKAGGMEKFPVNSWELATLDGLNACAEFLAYVNGRLPTAPPLGQPRRRSLNLQKRAEIRASLFK